MRLSGSIDCFDLDSVYEFKCCQKIEKEHIIQLALYMFIMLKQDNSPIINHYYLFNIITDELIEIKSSLVKLEQMVEDIIQYKYGVNNRIDNETFVNTCLLLKS
jgi:hypothetical protein